MLLMIDNYDSFTYNIVQYFGELGQDVRVYRNDAITLGEIARLDPDYLVISPGPCAPQQAGVSLAAIREFAGKIPLLGVCLGHQSIGEAFGGRIVHAKKLMHGKTSPVHHTDKGLFKGLPNPVTCTRYHSLAIAIRTAVIQDGQLHVQAGAGIVADSDPTSEWQETQNKARAVLRAAEMAENGLDTRFE